MLRTGDAAFSKAGLLLEVGLAPRWRILAGVSVAVLALAAAAMSYSGARVASAAGSELSALDARVRSSFSGVQDTKLKEASDEVGSLHQRLATPFRAIRWTARLGAAVPWLPLLSMEASGVEAQVDRVDTDLDAASGLLDWAGQFISAYDEAQLALVSSQDAQRMLSFRSPLREIEAGFGRSGGALGPDGAGARYSLMARLGPISGRMDDLVEAERTIRDGADAGEKAARLMQVLLDLAEASRPLVSRFGGDAVALDVDGADSVFAALAGFQRGAVAAKANAAETSAALARLSQAGPFSERMEALVRLMDALVAIGEGGVLGFEALRPAYDIVAVSQNGLLDAENGLARALATLPEHGTDISRAVARLAEGEKALMELQADGGLPLGSSGLPGILSFVSQVREGLQMLNGVAPVASKLLGQGGPRRYLILGQSADELRGTGGFVSGIWSLDVQEGSLGEVAYYDAVRVDDWERLALYPVAPPDLEEHMNAWVWLLRDVSWDPDFRVTAQSAAAMFKIGQRQDVDGVVAVNQWGLLGLIDAVGGVMPPEGGDPITANNLITVLERGTDTYGRAYMDLVLQGVIDKMAHETSLSMLVRIASAMYRALESRDLVLNFDDPDAQRAMEGLGWAGVIESVRGDYLYVVDSNVGWSKVDRNIERQVSYFVDLSKRDRPRAQLTLVYINHSGPGSPPCEPQWLNRGTDYSQLVNACYWNFVRVYMPIGSRLLSQTTLPLPELSVSVEIGKGEPGQETGEMSARHDKAVFSGLVVVPPGETREIGLVYDLPADSLVDENGSLVYQATLQKQPGVKTRKTSVALMPPVGYHVLDSSVPYVIRDGGQVSISLSLVRDVTIRVAFEED
jgi:hypothetical protein